MTYKNGDKDRAETVLNDNKPCLGVTAEILAGGAECNVVLLR